MARLKTGGEGAALVIAVASTAVLAGLLTWGSARAKKLGVPMTPGGGDAPAQIGMWPDIKVGSAVIVKGAEAPQLGVGDDKVLAVVDYVLADKTLVSVVVTDARYPFDGAKRGGTIPRAAIEQIVFNVPTDVT